MLLLVRTCRQDTARTLVDSTCHRLMARVRTRGQRLESFCEVAVSLQSDRFSAAMKSMVVRISTTC